MGEAQKAFLLAVLPVQLLRSCKTHMYPLKTVPWNLLILVIWIPATLIHTYDWQCSLPTVGVCRSSQSLSKYGACRQGLPTHVQVGELVYQRLNHLDQQAHQTAGSGKQLIL